MRVRAARRTAKLGLWAPERGDTIALAPERRHRDSGPWRIAARWLWTETGDTTALFREESRPEESARQSVAARRFWSAERGDTTALVRREPRHDGSDRRQARDEESYPWHNADLAGGIMAVAVWPAVNGDTLPLVPESGASMALVADDPETVPLVRTIATRRLRVRRECCTVRRCGSAPCFAVLRGAQYLSASPREARA
jgi:hypothetical protein